MAAALVLAFSMSVFAGRSGYFSATANVEGLADAREAPERAVARATTATPISRCEPARTTL